MLAPASAAELKDGLKKLSQKELLELTLRLARFKKENKELISYRLFHSHDPSGYLQDIEYAVIELMEGLNLHSLFILKKQLRKITGLVNRHLKYVADAEVEAGARLFVAEQFKGIHASWKKSTQITRMYQSQLKKADQAIARLHPDLQSDYSRKFAAVSL